MGGMDTGAVLDLMVSVAARVITPRFRALADGEIIEKSPGDLVTVADREAEELLTQALAAHYPDALVVGEEAVAADRSLLERLPLAEHAWVIDPIDGTRNFVRGSAHHAVMVAQIVAGTVTRGWIWQPALAMAYTAERGRGLMCNGAPVPVAPADEPGGAVTGRAARRMRQGVFGEVTIGPPSFCCGVDYPDLACGRTDFLLFRRSMPWDHAAGTLFVEEAGGTVCHLDGSTYDPRRAHGSLLAARGARVWRQVRDALPQ